MFSFLSFSLKPRPSKSSELVGQCVFGMLQSHILLDVGGAPVWLHRLLSCFTAYS